MKHTLPILKSAAAIAAFVALPVGFTACNKDDVAGGDSVAAQALTITVADGDDEVELEEGATVGVIAVSDGIAVTAHATVTAQAGGLLANTDSIIAVMQDGVELCAYSPASLWTADTYGETLNFSVPSDQSDEADYESADLMLAPLTAVSDGKAHLVLNHMMAKVSIHLTDVTGNYDLTGTTVVMPGRNTTVTADLASATAPTVNGITADINAYMYENTVYRATASAIIAPGTMSSGSRLIDVSIDGETFSYTLYGTVEWEAGYEYVYRMRLTSDGLVPYDSYVIGWEDSDVNLTGSVSEQLALYDYIKNYAAQYMPTNLIGVGLTASYYIEDAEYRQVADDNFQILTTGNAMKHDAIVTSTGSLDFTTVDQFLNAVPADMKVYGHNFIWHTQQQQSYLRSLIEPVYVRVESQYPDAGRVNLISNGDFSTGTTSWEKWNGTDSITWNETEGNLSAGCLQIVNTYDTPSQQWRTQLYTALTETVPAGEPVYISYYIRTLSGAGSVRCSTEGASHFQSDQTVSTSWQRIEWEISSLNADLTGICIDIGAVANTYLIDDVVVSTEPFTETGYYQLKTDEEKKEALLEAMETWIQGMLEHVNTDSRFVGWDVINEPITGTNFRGIDNNFGGTYKVDGVTYYDSAPEENETTGLTLNWGDGHFYWGYYLGMDYAVKAFEFARKYASPNIKLFVNDYNLETSPSKLAKLIEFVDYIEQNGQTVDGIGTQMHLTASSITRDEIDAMFQTLANTGKLIRVTELDVALGTDAPDDDALQLQADVYQMVFESFKENVPEAQQSGITVWSMTDNSREHKYWLNGDVPNIFDASYGRKYAYKGVCDGIAGFDLSTTFNGYGWIYAYDTGK